MAEPTINHDEAVEYFSALLEEDSDDRLLRLTGTEKMGKSHLMTAVFPGILEEREVAFAILDLRMTAVGIFDLLGDIVSSLGDTVEFERYDAARERLLAPQGATVKNVVLIRSKLSAAGTPIDPWEAGRELTVQLAADLRVTSTPVVLLVDTVERAPETTQTWLMGTLLSELCRLPNVRIVIAGRTLPPSAGSYSRKAVDIELGPVEDLAAYVAYCEKAGIECPEQSIADFARAFRYTPGVFVDYVLPTFRARGGRA
jgi:hypothetical protein